MRLKVLFGLLAALVVSAVTPTQADAAPQGRLLIARPKNPPINPPPGPPSSQTHYFGAKTKSGYGGADLCQGMCVLPVSMPDTANYYYDTTQGPQGYAVPKSSGSKTYGEVRGTPLSGCETATLTDAAAHVVSAQLCADKTVAGDYTFRFRNGDNQTGGTGTNQLVNSLNAAAQGEEVVMRRNSGWNTTGNTDSVYHGQILFPLQCSTGTCATASTDFTGANWKIIRQEQGQTSATIGPIRIEGTGLVGTRWQNFKWNGEDTAVCNTDNGACDRMIYALSDKVWIDGGTMIGNPSDEYGRARVDGIHGGGRGWKITNLNMSYVYIGVSLASNGGGTYPTDLVDPLDPSQGGKSAPHNFDMVMTGNTFTNISQDVLDVPCVSYLTLTDNIFSDKKGSVTIGTAGGDPPWINPFDSVHVSHSDFTQFNCPTGVYQYYPGIIIERNLFLRGIGRDSLPFWTSPPFPDPNDSYPPGHVPPYTISIPTGAAHPNPNTGLGSGQGIYWSNWCGTVSGCTHNYTGTSIPRPYDLTLTSASIKDNVVMEEFANGIALPTLLDATVTGNAVLSPHPPATNLYDTSNAWSLGLASMNMGSRLGSTVVARNLIGGNTLSPTIGTDPTNINVKVTTQATYLINPGGMGSPRTLSDWQTYYAPIDNGPAEVGTQIFAGPFCPNGTRVNTADGSCP